MYPAKRKTYFTFLNDEQRESTQKNPVDFEKLVESFISNLDTAQSTRKTYGGSLFQFLRWLTKENNPYPSRETILRYKQILDSRGLKPTTRAIYLVAVRRFFEWTESLKLYPDIAKGIKGPRQSLYFLRDPLSLSQLKLLLNKIPRTTAKEKRDFALINLLARTGIRPIELTRAEVKDLQVKGDKGVFFIRGKGRDGKDECIVLYPESLTPILEYLRVRNSNFSGKPEAPLFAGISNRNSTYNKMSTISVSSIIRSYMRAAGIKTETNAPYSIRHGFACLCFKSGASFYDIQIALRHKNPTTTLRYLKGIERELRLKAAAEKGVSEILSKAGL